MYVSKLYHAMIFIIFIILFPACLPEGWTHVCSFGASLVLEKDFANWCNPVYGGLLRVQGSEQCHHCFQPCDWWQPWSWWEFHGQISRCQRLWSLNTVCRIFDRLVIELFVLRWLLWGVGLFLNLFCGHFFVISDRRLPFESISCCNWFFKFCGIVAVPDSKHLNLKMNAYELDKPQSNRQQSVSQGFKVIEISQLEILTQYAESTLKVWGFS